MNRRLLGFLGLGVLVLVVFFAINSFFGNKTSLDVNNINAEVVKVYVASKQNTGEQDLAYKPNSSPVAELYNPGKFNVKVKKSRSYVVVGSSNKPYYETNTQRINVGDSPSNAKVELALSEAYLKQLLAKEEPAALAALKAKYPAQFDSFTPTGGKLYKEGQWYAVKLVPKAGGDTYRVVLKKESSGWVVVTDPPALILSKPVYPNVPRDVLSDINNF